MSDAIRFDLPQSAIPKQWYNVQADLPRPLPPVLHPGTQQPVGPDDLAPLFPMGLILQEVSQDRWVEFLAKYVRFTSYGAQRRCCGRAGWKRRSIRQRISITSTRAFLLPAATS